MSAQPLLSNGDRPGAGRDSHAGRWARPCLDSPRRTASILQRASSWTTNRRLRAELADFHAAGGRAIVDCQPGGAGRDARALRRLSQATGVLHHGTTGFHQRKYYPPDSWLWSAQRGRRAAYFVEELRHGTRESTTNGSTRSARRRSRSASRARFEGQTRVLMEAAARAARQTGALILFHTERGATSKPFCRSSRDRGVPPTRLYICHVDKRPDEGFHHELAQAGALLGYDTFARPKYDPDRNVWPLDQGAGRRRA